MQIKNFQENANANKREASIYLYQVELAALTFPWYKDRYHIMIISKIKSKG